MTASGAAPATSTGATDVRHFRLIAIGAALSYFFDPENGKRRRKTAADRLTALVRRHGGRLVRGTVAETHALKQKATHLREEPKDYDDVTLARKVETEIFRPEDAPKGSVNVNVEGGIVYLRGEVERPELIDDLVEKARNVQGVREVENLLHLPGTPAPTKE